MLRARTKPASGPQRGRARSWYAARTAASSFRAAKRARRAAPSTAAKSTPGSGTSRGRDADAVGALSGAVPRPAGAHPRLVLDLARLLQPVSHRRGDAVPRPLGGLQGRAQPRLA